MTIVNKFSGEVLMENANSYEDLENIGYIYDEETDCLIKEGKSYSVDSLADEREMSYSEYKNNFAHCRTRKNSYDPATKTIHVFVGWFDEVTGEVR